MEQTYRLQVNILILSNIPCEYIFRKHKATFYQAQIDNAEQSVFVKV